MVRAREGTGARVSADGVSASLAMFIEPDAGSW